MSQQRIGGILYVRVNGELVQAKGSWSYNLGASKREAMVSTTGVAGYKEEPQVPYVEGEVFHQAGLDLQALQRITDATVTLELANGKTVVLREAWYAAEGTGSTDEGGVEARFEGVSAELI